MMNRVTPLIVQAALCVAWSAPPVLAQAPLPAKAVRRPQVELAGIISDYEAFDRAENPIASGLEGDRAALSRWPGVTPADDARRRTRLRAFKVRLEAISSQELKAGDRLNLALLRWQVDLALEGLQYDEGRLGFTNEGGPEAALRFLEAMTVIHSRADAEAYLARLEAVGRSIADATENMRRGVRTGFVQSRMSTEVVLAQLKA